MQPHDFLGQVQHRARLASTQDALRATRATLEKLAERLAGREPEHLAAQLPEEIGRFLTKPYLEAEGVERFSSDEFFARVSQGEGADLPDAVFHARVVIDVLKEAVSAGEIDDVRSQLPDDYQRLFEAGSEGRMPSS